MNKLSITVGIYLLILCEIFFLFGQCMTIMPDNELRAFFRQNSLVVGITRQEELATVYPGNVNGSHTHWIACVEEKRVGAAVEIMDALHQIFELRHMYYWADGWGFAKNGLGDLLNRSVINATVPQLYMTYERESSIDFTTPVWLVPDMCFFSCYPNRPSLVLLPEFSIDLASWMLVISCVITFVLILMGYNVWLFRHRQPCVNIARIFDQSLAMGFLVLIMQAIIQSAFLKLFTLHSHYLYKTERELADLINNHGFSITFYSNSTAQYNTITQTDAFPDLKAALAKNPSAVRFVGMDKEAAQLAMSDHKIAALVTERSIAQLLRCKQDELMARGIWCSCQYIKRGTPFWSAIGVQPGNLNLQDRLSRAVLRLHELGIVRYLIKKYGMADTFQALNEKFDEHTVIYLAAMKWIFLRLTWVYAGIVVVFMSEIAASKLSVRHNLS